MKAKLFFIIALLCVVSQGAWAQTEVSTKDALTSAISGGNSVSVKLTADIALSEKLAISSGKTVTIDLNGHKLSRSLSANENYGMVIQNYGNLTITDGSNNNSGQITGGRSYNGAGILCESGSTLTVNGGTFKKNDVSRTDNGNHGRGGAIFMNPNTTLTITGGVFDGNSAYQGGAIYIDDGGPNNGSPASATISGATFQNCWVTGDGGAIYNQGTLTISDCTISGNRASLCGGGVFSNSNISMSGSVNITGNEIGNLYLNGDNTKINVTGALTGSSIGVSLSNYGTNGRAFTSGFGSNNSTAHANDFFSKDVDGASLFDGTGGEAYLSAQGFTYIECSWEGGNTAGRVVKTQKLANAVHWYGEDEIDGTQTTHWYYASGNVNSTNKRIVVKGNVNLILLDGCNYTEEKGIHIQNGATLTIYCQSYGSNMGTLRCTGDDGSANNGDAAIGGNNNAKGGSLVIHGGNIYAKPYHNCAAGIGGGQHEDSGLQSVVIYGGTITAEGTSDGAGIGCGENNNTRPSVTIYGGTVTATGGSNGAGIGGGENRGNGVIKIYGGTVNANGGDNGAGIGGGKDGSQDNPIYIYGGIVNANGGEFGAGIGGGADGNGNTTDIYGGNVYATGGELAPGIGSGGRTEDSGNPVCGTVTFHGGYVEAKTPGGSSSCIGGGLKGKGGTVNFYGGTVKAIYTNRYSNKTASSTHSEEVYDGQCYVGRGGADYGNKLDKGTIIFGTGMMVIDKNDNTVTSGSRVSACQEEPDYNRSTTVTIKACNHSGATYTIKDGDYHTVGCSYCTATDEAHSFGDYGECSVCGLISLADNADNSSIIDHWKGETKSVVLTGRKLYKDGGWNTLCLPFAATLSGDLASATVKELDNENTYNDANGNHVTGYDNGTLYLYFKEGPATLQARQPYLVKWDNSNTYVESPVFTNVILGNDNPISINSKDGKLSFVGNFDPVTIGSAGDNTKLYLGDDNKLYYPNGAMSINAFRAYFQLSGITAADLPAGVRMFFDDGETTGICDAARLNDKGQMINDNWYDLSGRKIVNGKLSNGKLPKGIYINKGKLVVIK